MALAGLTSYLFARSVRAARKLGTAGGGPSYTEDRPGRDLAMAHEMRSRKRLFMVLVALVEWQLVLTGLIAIAYGETSDVAVPLFVGALVLVGIAAVLWSELVARKAIRNPRIGFRIRMGLFVSYPLLLGLAVLLALPLGLRYLALLNPLAATLARVSSVGSIAMLVVLAAAIFDWQRALTTS